ncbi:hypothetical protein TNCT6_65750 [Streptomyces sp. 6-11-2]|nr:hypothetical protein TNCT6_65750 [Streptomyces sp. 6-11-2]
MRESGLPYNVRTTSAPARAAAMATPASSSPAYELITPRRVVETGNSPADSPAPVAHHGQERRNRGGLRWSSAGGNREDRGAPAGEGSLLCAVRVTPAAPYLIGDIG